MVSEIVKYLLFWYLVVIMLRICYNYNCIYAKILKRGIMRMKKKPLALWIFTGLALGIVAGMLLMGRPDIAEIYIKPFGTLFLNLLKFIVVPIVLFSIMNGVISMKDIKKVGSIGGKTVIYYMCTTFLRSLWAF